MKIIFFTEYFSDETKIITGGVESRLFYLVKFLTENNHEVIVIKRTDKYSFNTFRTVIERILFFINWVFKIFLLNFKVRADIVEGTNFTTYILAYFYARRIRAKAVAWYPDVFLGKAIARLGFFNGLLTEIAERISLQLLWDGIIALSNETKRKLIKAGADERKIEVIYGGVDYNRYNPYNRYSKFKVPTIICIARLVNYKRVEDAITAVYLLKEAIPDIRLLIVGEGPKKRKLKIRSQNLKVNVEFLGRVSEEKKWELLARSHIHVLSSTVEGFGLVTIEALSAGTPVVNADTPITREVLCGSKGGLVYPVGDYVGLAECIDKLLSDKVLYSKKVKEGLKLASVYKWEKVNAQTERFYEHLLLN